MEPFRKFHGRIKLVVCDTEGTIARHPHCFQSFNRIYLRNILDSMSRIKQNALLSRIVKKDSHFQYLLADSLMSLAQVNRAKRSFMREAALDLGLNLRKEHSAYDAAKIEFYKKYKNLIISPAFSSACFSRLHAEGMQFAAFSNSCKWPTTALLGKLKVMQYMKFRSWGNNEMRDFGEIDFKLQKIFPMERDSILLISDSYKDNILPAMEKGYNTIYIGKSRLFAQQPNGAATSLSDALFNLNLFY